MSDLKSKLSPTPIFRYKVPLPEYTGDHSASQHDLTNINSGIMDSELSPISGIYLDIKMLRDIELGALLRLCTPYEYTYILNNLSTYENRIVDTSILDYFPEIKSVTMQDIVNYIADTKNTLELGITSPTTSLQSELVGLIAHVLRHNRISQLKPTPISVCVNFYPLPHSEELKSVYSKLIGRISELINFQYTSYPLHMLPINTLYTSNGKPRYGMYFIYDMISFISNDSTSLVPYRDEMRYYNTPIYSVRRVDPDIYTSNYKHEDIDYEQLFKNTEAALKLSSEFTYIDLKFSYNK